MNFLIVKTYFFNHFTLINQKKAQRRYCFFYDMTDGEHLDL